MKLDHLTAVVTDVDEATRAVVRLLGGEVVRTTVAGMRIHTLRLGDAELHLNEPIAPGPLQEFQRQHGPGLHHLALRVDALEETLVDLARSGIVARGEPVRVAAGVREVFLDPSTVGGLWIQLVERDERAHAVVAALDDAEVARVAASGPAGGVLPLAQGEREHHVDAGALGALRIVETPPAAKGLDAATRHAVVLLPGPIATAGFFHIGVAGYHAAERLAQRGHRVFAVDLPGTGGSDRPADGRSLRFASQVEAIATALRRLCAQRGVETVDVVGESFGGAIASQLAVDGSFVRSCVMVSVLYRTPSPQAHDTFLHPGWRAMLEATPDGYLDVGPELLAGILGRSPEAVRRWVLEHEAGRYAVAPLLGIFDLPYFDPSKARARGLVVHGQLEPSQPVEDARALAASYGANGAAFVELEGAGHIPRIEDERARERFWKVVLDFIDAG